jgi:signal transduction histidine kinase
MFPSIYAVCIVLLSLSLIFAFYSGRRILILIDEMKGKINQLHLQLITMLEEEKRQISVDLHDGVGQIITALKWGISQREEEEKLKLLCDQAVNEIRIVSKNLMPPELSQLGLYAAVAEEFRKKQIFYKVEMNFWFNERLKEFTFREGIDVNLYRMIQELVQNTIKHSGADTISLVIFREANNFVMRYEDNGKGMREEAPMPKVLQYRADLVGARIKRSNAVKGLIFTFEIPFERIFNESV